MKLSHLDSFLPEGKPLKRNLLTATTAAEAKPLASVKIEDREMSAIKDSAWLSTNHATERLMQSSGGEEPAKAIAVHNKEDIEAKTTRPSKSKKRVPATKPKKREKDKEEEEEDQEDQPLKKPTLKEPVLVDVPYPVPLEQHNRRDNQVALFAYNIERPHRPTNEALLATPPATAVLNYCATFKSELPWYSLGHQTVANSRNLTYQRVPIFRRSVLVTFLREPDQYERPCFNLDREPLPNEERVRCIAHRMSEEALGKGYRLRELLFNDQSIKINAAIANGKNPMEHLYQIPEMCVMCHVWLTTEACLDQKNRLAERGKKDFTSPPEGGGGVSVVIMNRFMVDVDKPGEYDLRKMLCSDDVSLGIWGPFPMWNRRNYIPCTVGQKGLRGFEESDNLLFRLPRVPLQMIEFSTAESVSIQSAPTFAAPANMTSRQ